MWYQFNLPPPPPPLKELGVFNLIKPEGHNFPIREKHVPKLKRDLKASLRKNLATYWLTLDTRHSQVCNRFSFPNGQPQSKNLKQQKTFPLSRYNILSYNQNQEITKTKAETKTIYQKIIQEGSKQHTIAGEIQWKKHLPTIDFN